MTKQAIADAIAKRRSQMEEIEGEIEKFCEAATEYAPFKVGDVVQMKKGKAALITRVTAQDSYGKKLFDYKYFGVYALKSGKWSDKVWRLWDWDIQK